MNYLSLFTGVGGCDLAIQHLLGHKCIGYVEIEEYCQKVIAQRIKDGLLDRAPIFGDIRTFSDQWAFEYKGVCDIITGGVPCQDISCAGKGAGITGPKSSLWFDMERIIGIIRPRYVYVENSPQLIRRGIDVVTGGLAKMGYNSEWGIVSAADVGANHIRKRCWILAYSDGERLEE